MHNLILIAPLNMKDHGGQNAPTGKRRRDETCAHAQQQADRADNLEEGGGEAEAGRDAVCFHLCGGGISRSDLAQCRDEKKGCSSEGGCVVDDWERNGFQEKRFMFG
ncbi:uncharacterized protein AB675_7360 [Cyphellophora attinorum]|uniref:Uncharacterized protein n=1 Tax=Cyphellophora attinorum TaxID=1664694 RepID=A0A0N1NWP4_9EURO|nr:uncharacterized protein AB675_7360 [Phialophora attinorum]KPI36340.1 hypothetical protein AB675_7360 [Phialophora attinorum]